MRRSACGLLALVMLAGMLCGTALADEQQYLVSLRLLRINAEGQVSVLAEPNLCFTSDKPAEIRVGGAIPNIADQPIDFGTIANLRVARDKDGDLALLGMIEVSQPIYTAPNCVSLDRWTTHFTQKFSDGKTYRIVDSKHAEGRRVVEVKVQLVEPEPAISKEAGVPKVSANPAGLPPTR